MRILIDIGHPAHVHIFKNFAWIFTGKGHDILFTVRDKENALYLLKQYKFNSILVGKHFKSRSQKIWGLVKFNAKLLKVALKFKPDLFLSHGSIYAAHVSGLLKKPHISVEDTGNMEQIRLYRPFTEVILTPSALQLNLGDKKISYNGYHELSYLRPAYFKPDKKIYETLKLSRKNIFSVVRFVSWTATHDTGMKGIPLALRIKAVQEFSKYGEVFISSEADLPADLQKYKLNIKPEEMHHVLAFANLLFSESATMASECAVLGTPSVYLDDKGRYYTDEQEKKYKLVNNYTQSINDIECGIQKGCEILSKNEAKSIWRERRDMMLNDKIDVTAFWVWFVENYPESVKIMKENQDYQCRFK